MIKEALAALGNSARDLFRNWRVLLLLAAVYALLLASVYLFFATGVANAWQLVVTAATAVAAPLLLLLLEAASANAALPDATAARVARRAPRDLLKVLLLALPVVALALLVYYLLDKLPGWLPRVEEAPSHSVMVGGVEARPVPLHWQEALTSSLWLLLLGFALPLVAAHLWIAAAREGLGATLKGLHRVAGRAFAPKSVLVYALGLFVFGLTPYFVVYTRTAVANSSAELLVFGLRLSLAFALTLVGWVITLGALARVTPPLAEAPATPEPAGPAAPPPPTEHAAAEPQLQA
ncbi:MAG: hypothetical protein LC795_01565 [Acidobacteria bacterium]|nr:hypothetical protein [Acidobacteriota bacterium]